MTVSSLIAEKMLVDAAQALASLPRDWDKVCCGLVNVCHPSSPLSWHIWY